MQNEIGIKLEAYSKDVPLQGNNKVHSELTRIAEEVQYGRQTPEQSEAAFVDAAKAAIGQS